MSTALIYIVVSMQANNNDDEHQARQNNYILT